MKLINPSVKIEFPVSEIEIFKKVELAGRTCYKSEGKITDNSCISFFRMILNKKHLSVLEHVSITARFICSRAMTHELVRHRLASYCISGNTILKSMSQKKWTVRELFEYQNDEKRKGRLKLINLRSVDENTNIIVGNKIVNILYNGIGATYRVKTKSGREISTTMQHLFYTPNGYKRLADLKVGDKVYANGIELLENEEWLREQYLEKNMTRKDLAKLIGCCESILYRAFKKFGIVKCVSNYPNRKPGHGNVGMFSQEEIERIRERMTGKNSPNWKEEKGEGACRRIARKSKKLSCEICGKNENLEQHHFDGNPLNMDEENLITVCTKHHRAMHKIGTFAVFTDEIISIEFDCEEDVYDIEMMSPHHNFVANGLVIHNSQESQRYCRYNTDDIQFIIPEWFGSEGKEKDILWSEAMEYAELKYIKLLETGQSAQDARDVLPNATKTEIVVTANLREWIHILKLRTAQEAHPEMRRLMNLFVAELNKYYPNLMRLLNEHI